MKEEKKKSFYEEISQAIGNRAQKESVEKPKKESEVVKGKDILVPKSGRV